MGREACSDSSSIPNSLLQSSLGMAWTGGMSVRVVWGKWVWFKVIISKAWHHLEEEKYWIRGGLD